ncbi:MAG: hypothetical protein RLZZ324_323 [Candidatus Parcubacteria bacterium]|jgi:hypothetical protein
MSDLASSPKLIFKNRGDSTERLTLRLAAAARKCIVRFTGGCGEMSEGDGDRLKELFSPAFVGFEGALTFGGTRMVYRADWSRVRQGITEIPPHLKQTVCPNAVLLGIVPRTADIGICEIGVKIEDDPKNDFFTIVHPDQDHALVIQINADNACPKIDDKVRMSAAGTPLPAPNVWDAEFEECMRITGILRECFDGYGSVLIAYNGGGTTEREIVATSDRGWPVILIKGSGRKTDEYASNKEFLALRDNVRVVDKDPSAIRAALAEFGAVPERRMSLVGKGSRSA